MTRTVYSPCAPSGLRQEAVAARQLPPIDEAHSAAPASSDQLPDDAEAFADLLCEDPLRAQALLDALTPAQRTALAEAHAAWLRAHGFPAAPEAVLAAWTAPVDHEDHDAGPERRRNGHEAAHLASGGAPCVVVVIVVVQPPPPCR